MAGKRRVLIAGESWTVHSTHQKGFDSFSTVEYAEGIHWLRDALETGGFTVDYQPSHVAARNFPFDAQSLAEYDCVMLSDIGANTLLLPNSVFSRGERMPNRLDVLAEWVRAGGSLLMVGGYLSFQGIEAKANYRNTSLAGVLPVEMEVGDDREETPQGAQPTATGTHAVTQGLSDEWPVVLGYHRLEARAGSEVLARIGEHPLMVVDTEGKGRVAAFASDMGPHWLPAEFLAWEGYSPMWSQLIAWLARESD